VGNFTNCLPAARRDGLRWALAALVATHIVIFAVVFARTVMLVPFSDMITWLDQYAAFKQDGDFLHYLLVPHNEHRLVTIRLLTIADVELFGSHGIAFFVAALASLFGILALVLREVRPVEPTFGPGTALSIALVLTVPNAMTCSIPINSLYPITVLFVFLAIALAPTHRAPWGITAATGASLSNAIGLVVWPITLWLTARVSWLWFGVAAALGLLFAVTFVADQMQPASITVAHSIGDAVRYWPSFVGLPWSRSAALAVPAVVLGVGLVVVALALVATRLQASRLETVAVAFVLFSIGCSILAAIGRSGLHEPFPPVRYSIFMMPLHLGLLFLIIGRKWLTERVAVAVLAALTVQQLLAGYIAVHTAESLGVPVGF
jgi:hypothetical protein